MDDPPLLDTELTDQLFTCETEAEIETVRHMFAEFLQDMQVRLQRLDQTAGAENAPDAVGRELHQLRGVIANFGFSSAAAVLARLEQDWRSLARPEQQAGVRGARERLADGLVVLRERYPHLAHL